MSRPRLVQLGHHERDRNGEVGFFRGLLDSGNPLLERHMLRRARQSEVVDLLLLRIGALPVRFLDHGENLHRDQKLGAKIRGAQAELPRGRSLLGRKVQIDSDHDRIRAGRRFEQLKDSRRRLVFG